MPKANAIPASERRLLAFLLDPRSYPGRPKRIRLIQTHSAWVVLAGRHAYKVKKPVNFGFLDFSTLEKRRHFCEREVALNQRLCPWIYLGVVPIARRAGKLAFGDDRQVVEYAVKMRRMPER
ncbi:MAG: phosphotransferase, partial [Chthoniobacteraceae bacterium]